MSWAGTIALILIVIGSLGGVALVAYFSKDLPSPNKLSEREIPQSTKIFSRDGQLLYEIYAEERRTLIQLEDIPDYLKLATLAAEDADFYEHKGFDIKGFLYAVYRNILTGSSQGGSTIPQQLVKNVLLTSEKTYTRKIKELLLAVEVNRRYSKDEILQMYLNEVPYGGQAWGVGAASEMYFGKHVRDISLAEAALLAGLPQQPTYYSPFGAYPENAKARQEYVLSLMVKDGALSREEADAAKGESLHYRSPGTDITAPHFVMFVKDELVREFGEKMVEQGGLRVWTTLDLNMQRVAEEEVGFQLDRLEKSYANAGNAGLVAADPRTGEILAMVGSRDYFDTENDGNVNVTLAQRQPGSSIKPIMYVTAFEMGYTPATFLSDIRTCWNAPDGDYCPTESDGRYWGPMLLRDALANSRNIPAVKMLQQVGIENMLETAHRLGITTLNDPERYGLSLTLGGGEVRLIDMVQVFSVFSTGGIKNDLIPVSRVEDNEGKVIRRFLSEDKSKRVLEEKYAYLLNNIMSDNRARQRLFGANNKLEIGRTAAVKTGTTNDNRDAWTIGYTPQLVAGVWVGNNDNVAMAPTIQGSTGATPIWHYFMKRILEGQETLDWERPKEIVNVTIDTLSGKLPREGKDYPTRSELFVKGTQPTQTDNFHVIVDVCKDKGLLATDFHKNNDLSEAKTYVILKELNSDWQSYTDAWMSGVDGYGSPPTEICPIEIEGELAEEPLVEITLPKDEAQLKVYGFDVTANIYTNSTITNVEFYWDSILVKEVTSVPYTVTYSLSMNEGGEHTIKVRAYDSEGDEGSDVITVHLPAKDGDKVVTPVLTPILTPETSVTP